MINMSDILKKLRQPKKEEPPESKTEPKRPLPSQEPTLPEEKKPSPISFKPPQNTPLSFPKEKEPDKPRAFVEYTEARTDIASRAGMGLESQRQEITKAQRLEEIKNKSLNLYEEALVRIEILLQKVKDNQKVRVKDVKDTTRRLIDQLSSDDTGLIYIVCSTNTDNYLWAHSVNVCILSLEIGLGLDFDRQRLLELGLSAIIHDLGMVKVEDIVENERILTPQEYEKVKEHPVHTAKILEQNVEDSFELPSGLTDVTGQVHERIKGTGYPGGIKEPQIHEYARIIAVADTYEALTHKRPHRNAYVASEAMKEILKRTYDDFDAGIVKALVNRIGIYPVGSWIQLSTNEIGQVVHVNKEYLLKPTVNIIFDANGHRLTQPKEIDLAKTPSLTLKNSFSVDQVPPAL